MTVQATVPFLPEGLRDRVVVFDEMPDPIDEIGVTSPEVANLGSSNTVGDNDRDNLDVLHRQLVIIEAVVRKRLKNEGAQATCMRRELSEIVQAAVDDPTSEQAV